MARLNVGGKAGRDRGRAGGCLREAGSLQLVAENPDDIGARKDQDFPLKYTLVHNCQFCTACKMAYINLEEMALNVIF